MSEGVSIFLASIVSFSKERSLLLLIPYGKMELSMTPDDRKLQERWKCIALRVSKEQNPDRLTELANELIEALNDQMKAPDAKGKAQRQHKQVPSLVSHK